MLITKFIHNIIIISLQFTRQRFWHITHTNIFHITTFIGMSNHQQRDSAYFNGFYAKGFRIFHT